jgi:hypothetical protein
VSRYSCLRQDQEERTMRSLPLDLEAQAVIVSVLG